MPELSTWRQGVVGRLLAPPADVQQRNIRSVVIDGIGVGIVSGVTSFLAVFLVRLGASPLLVGLLTSMPALTGMLLAIPLGRYLERQRNMVPWYSRARALVQASFALMGVVPFFLSGEDAALAIIAIWALVTVPQTVVNITFTVVMGAVAGPRQRQYVMSRRWSILGATTAITVALVGAVLDRIAFPLNYQVVFMASFLGGMLSFAFSSRISIPDNQPPPAEERRPEHPLRAAWEALRASPDFSRFVLSAFVFNFGMNLALPLFPLYWVREVHASDFWIGLINTVNNGIVLAGYFMWTAVTHRKGNVLVLRLCAFGLVLYPLLTGLTSSVEPLLVYAALAGIFSAGLNLVLFDISLATVPPDRVPSYIALYQLSNYVTALAAPLLGTTLAGAFGYAPALFVAAGLRLLGAVLFVALRVGEGERPARPAD
ncbi:MAG TPA: MFS transporter [Roseiflexaceae bacterium]|nr:MFS transporter [Roseiflexaceae bacterium]